VTCRAGKSCADAFIIPIRASIVGPLRSATKIRASIAVCHSCAAASFFGSLVM
jgi:hypothetical protein